jgi:hypothetical protein
MIEAGKRVRIRTMKATTGRVHHVATFRTRTPYLVEFSGGGEGRFAEGDLIPTEMPCDTCGEAVSLSIDAIGLCQKCQKQVHYQG